MPLNSKGNMLLKLYDDNPDPRKMQFAIDALKNGGVIIIPTDTVYAFACDLMNKKGVEKLQRIANKGESLNLSIICYDLSNLSDYCMPINNNVFKMIKKVLPGPYTFIFKANNNVPKIFHSKKKEIGIRVPNNKIARELVRLLGNPLACSSVHDMDEIIDYTTDPELIYDTYSHQVDAVIDAGFGDNQPSTVISCSEQDDIQVLRYGKGEVDFLL